MMLDETLMTFNTNRYYSGNQSSNKAQNVRNVDIFDSSLKTAKFTLAVSKKQ